MRHALVSGGANGIGAAVCRALARDGLTVTLCDLDAAAGNAVAAEIDGRFCRADARDPEAVSTVARERPVEVLVNNVGADQHAFFTELGPDDWRALIAINLESAFAFTRAVLPAMQAAGYGRIVTVSSEAGRLGSRGGSVYAAAKAGLIGFTRSIARENARYGITANAVLPGPVRTPMVERAVAEHGTALLDAMRDLTLLRRLGEPEEIASAVAYLASPAASFITGEALGVSGGMGCGAG